MSAFYNELDAFPAEWLRNLIGAGHIADGVVDERSIRDVRADDLSRHGQCHFFAGIGVWSHALRLAGWPDDRAVWTGSCPCQPFAPASRGRGEGFGGPRDLWPRWLELIRERRPDVVFGEQVAGGDGRRWMERTADDLEVAGYAVGTAMLCASAFGFPARRRFFFAAHPNGEGERARPVDAEMARVPAPAAVPAEAPLERGDLGPFGASDPGRMARLRAYGNAINAQVAASFIQAFMGVS